MISSVVPSCARVINMFATSGVSTWRFIHIQPSYLCSNKNHGFSLSTCDKGCYTLISMCGCKNSFHMSCCWNVSRAWTIGKTTSNSWESLGDNFMEGSVSNMITSSSTFLARPIPRMAEEFQFFSLRKDHAYFSSKAKDDHQGEVVEMVYKACRMSIILVFIFVGRGYIILIDPLRKEK